MMTAEIAILNKTAVVLAADSAVTISSGNQQQKIYDSGDKLFELSFKHPIGVMIYNNLQFSDVPLANGAIACILGVGSWGNYSKIWLVPPLEYNFSNS